MSYAGSTPTWLDRENCCHSHHLVHVQTTCQPIISYIGSVSAWLHEVSFLGVCKKKALWLNTEFMCLHVIACKLYNQFLYTLPDSTFKAFSLKQNYYWYGPTYELFSSSSVRPSVWFMAELFSYLSGCAVQITCVLLHWTRLCLTAWNGSTQALFSAYFPCNSRFGWHPLEHRWLKTWKHLLLISFEVYRMY